MCFPSIQMTQSLMEKLSSLFWIFFKQSTVNFQTLLCDCLQILLSSLEASVWSFQRQQDKALGAKWQERPGASPRVLWGMSRHHRVSLYRCACPHRSLSHGNFITGYCDLGEVLENRSNEVTSRTWASSHDIKGKHRNKITIFNSMCQKEKQ